MKKVICLILVFCLAYACKSKSVTNTKLDNKTEVALKGNWKISSVNFPGSEYIKVTSFNIADSKCLVNSEWNFISNNNKGSFSINKNGCSPYSANITWYVNKEGNMVIKILDEGIKSKNVKEGYVLKLTNVSETSFQLIDNINVGGKLTDVVYQFNKI